MSKAARFAVGIAIVAVGFVLVATVSTVAGIVVIVLGALVMPGTRAWGWAAASCPAAVIAAASGP
jgi:hypothetical protein